MDNIAEASVYTVGSKFTLNCVDPPGFTISDVSPVEKGASTDTSVMFNAPVPVF